MAFFAHKPAQTDVVENEAMHPHLRSRLTTRISHAAAAALTVTLALCMLWLPSTAVIQPSTAWADDPQPAQTSQPNQSPDAASPSSSSDSTAEPVDSASAQAQNSESYITDTPNLLGDHLSEVSDAIAATKQETGVTVRLLYLDSFNTTESAEQWASSLLASLNPAPNTVMLAVAANDGNLVVVVSPNSDEWLRKQSTVDDLSDAAIKPIVDANSGNGPDWAQSALSLMAAIKTAKDTSTAHSSVSAGIVVLIVIIVLLLVLAIVMIWWRKTHKPRRKSRHSRRAAEERWYESIAESRQKAHAHRRHREAKEAKESKKSKESKESKDPEELEESESSRTGQSAQDTSPAEPVDPSDTFCASTTASGGGE
ncbi:DUF6479 family protein [Bifidobacterium gallicum]|nr:DUF6479 family protein [Bifidobacterium gallicum]